MNKCLRPKQIDGFCCDWTRCGSSCCREWRISVDDVTLGKWLNLPESESKANILAGVAVDGKRNKTKIREDGKCYYLREDGLCLLQHDYGAEFLADVCHEYPRVTYRLSDDFVEQSLTLTCPVAVELVLRHKEPLEFVEGEMCVGRENFVVDMRGKGLPTPKETVDVQGVGVAVLQDRRFTLDTRLFLLSVLYEEMDKALVNAPLSEVLTERRIASLTERAMALAAQNIFASRRYIAYMTRLFAAVYDSVCDDNRLRSMNYLYDACHRAFFDDVLTDKRHIAENFAVNKFFMTLCPYTNDGNLSFNCRTFILGVKLTEFALFVTAAKDGGRMTEQDMLKIIAYVGERLDHNKDTARTIRRFAAESNENDADFRATLLNPDI